jgi:hypothetical protein
MVNRRQLLKLSALGTASFAAPLAYSASKITMAYNTGNPPGSTHPKDLIDNAEDFDYLMTGSGASHPNRLGVSLKSWKGMEGEHNADQLRRENEFDADQTRRESEFDEDQAERVVEFNKFLDSSGYETPVDYVPGISITRTTQQVRHLGELYRPKDNVIPFVTTTFAADEEKWISNGDNSLRQEMASPEDGTGLMVHRRSALSGAVAMSLHDLLALVVHAEEFGWPAVEAGACMNLAIAAAAERSAGYVCYSSPHFNQQTPIVLANGVVIKGPGSGIEGQILVANGVAIEAQVMTPDFNAIYDAVPGSVLNGVSRDCGLMDVYLNGNNANCPVPTDWRNGVGVKMYCLRPVIDNVRILNSQGIGLYSAYKSTGRSFPDGYSFKANLDLDVKDRGIHRLYIYNSGFEGFVFEGPSDIPVDQVFIGWPAKGLDVTVWQANAKSLRFTKGGVISLQVTAGGSGYTSAGVTITSATGTGFTGTCVVESGSIARVIVTSPGYEYSRTDTVNLTGDGSGCALTLHVDDKIDGFVMVDEGVELGFVHSFDNYQGYAIKFRNKDASYPRLNGAFLMGESSWGGIHIGGHWRYQVGRVDAHVNCRLPSHPPCMPSMLADSDRGGTVGQWQEYSPGTSGTAPALVIQGNENDWLGGKLFSLNVGGDGVRIGGVSNSAKFSARNTAAGFYALSTEPGMTSCMIEMIAHRCQGVWRHRAGVNPASQIKINNSYPVDNFSTQFNALATIDAKDWKDISIISKQDGGSPIYRSKNVVFGTVNAALTTFQEITISHFLVRTPKIEDCRPFVRPNSGSVTLPTSRCYVTEVTQASIKVAVEFSAAGTGTATVQVDIG